MKNNFAEVYAQHSEIKARYLAAEKQGNEAEMMAARNEHRAFEERMQAHGESYATVYRLYEAAMEAGNDLINISEVHQYRDEAALITSFREYGIEAFTFSSGWSSAIENAGAFVQHGCILQGMAQVNSGHTDFVTGEPEKRAALLFKLAVV